MNAPSPGTQPRSTELATRIADERQRLLAEQNLESELTSQRLAPLEAGDDEALDRVEQNLNACRDRQLRVQERLELLESRLAEARESEACTYLDRIALRAERARELGQELIQKDYAKQAAALARTLTKLASLDAVIADANTHLRDAGRDPITNSNFCRSFPGREVVRTVHKTVGISHPAHPGHGIGVRHWGTDEHTLNNGNRVKNLADVEIVETECLTPIWRDNLPEAVRLPGAGPCDAEGRLPDIWPSREKADVCDVTQLTAEIDAQLGAAPSRATRTKDAS